MSVVAVINGKGGVGKTTTARYLARYFALREPGSKPLLVAPVPHCLAKHHELPNCEIACAKFEEIPLIVAKNSGRRIVIDCGTDFIRARSALELSDLIVVPIVPGFFEFSVTKRTVEKLQAESPGVPVRVAMTMLSNRNQQIRQTRRLFGNLLLKTRVYWTESVCMGVYSTTFDFAPDSLPSQQYARLGDEIIETLDQLSPVAA